jgi:hypothetical protein
MNQNELDDWLLDLGPGDLSGDLPQKLRDRAAGAESLQTEIDAELRYLQLVSSRRVRLPNDAYFARARQKIYERVTIPPLSTWAKIKVAIFPQVVRPVPAMISGALLTIALVTVLLYTTPGRKMDVHPNFGPYASTSDTYAANVTNGDESLLSEQDLKEYRRILMMSAALLGSPSSLARSQALAGGNQ